MTKTEEQPDGAIKGYNHMKAGGNVVIFVKLF